MSSTAHNSSIAPEPVGLYPHARRVGNLLFLSGIGPRRKGSKDIPGVTLDANSGMESSLFGDAGGGIQISLTYTVFWPDGTQQTHSIDYYAP